jgi:hypothetical protein
VYGVNVVKTPPFKKQFTGYGIYMGQGMALTAAHVVGHWPFFTDPRVLVAGLDLPAKVVKQRFAKVDSTLLSVDENRLPISLRLRRNQLCKTSPPIGAEVVDVLPQAESRAHIIRQHQSLQPSKVGSIASSTHQNSPAPAFLIPCADASSASSVRKRRGMAIK